MKELPSRSRRFLKAKKKIVMGSAAVLLAAASIAVGTAIVPSDFEVPVLLANGEVITPPWYVTANGQQVALVDSKEDAREVVKKVAQQYKNSETVKIEIEEQTSAKEMNLENGDQKPEILSVEEAAAEIASKQELTVKTTEVITEDEPIDYKEVKEKTDKLYVGQTKVKKEGRSGLKKVTKEVTKENGEAVRTDVLKEETIQEPENQIVLTGTKEKEEALYTASRGTEKRGSGQLAAPVSSIRVTSSFGPRWGRTHLGVDLGMPTGSPISAADAGTVIFAGYSGSYGNLVKVDHGNGIVTYYAHCSEILAKQGQTVEKGAVIAKVGSTGNSTGPHLHFEVRVNGRNENPLNYL
ncbi:peptidoglycan DD-metalloendopeptidase family protein [Anaerovorax odorimutans]|uniref:Peptidoglycan DD-metalloendopeptidase family protein n=1 Tax=Anaerovorax odorimutans TaxID=109327 RepID=A0ABT1RTB2_9FIRM|nr:M23 family metallopeptidase [Anaerovorax odorimutans]MCQ4638364.1 peptidoglycan DD-metalloendopeptidase family protein [Anaerovorax odorimutans]